MRSAPQVPECECSWQALRSRPVIPPQSRCRLVAASCRQFALLHSIRIRAVSSQGRSPGAPMRLALTRAPFASLGPACPLAIQRTQSRERVWAVRCGGMPFTLPRQENVLVKNGQPLPCTVGAGPWLSQAPRGAQQPRSARGGARMERRNRRPTLHRCMWRSRPQPQALTPPHAPWVDTRCSS